MKKKRYTITVGNREWHQDVLDEAVGQATRQASLGQHMSRPAVIFDNETSLVVGVVTDDANGVKLHKLTRWPGDLKLEIV